jgi:hypothetical protein
MVHTHKRCMAGTAFLLAAVFAFSADAQTPNRRKQPRRTPTPAPVVTEPVVVSRADEYPTVVIEPVPEPSPSDVVSTDNGNSQSIEELRERLYQLENSNNNRKRDPDEKQKRIALNLDILTKAEQRAESLRKQLFEMIEKESTLQSHIDQINNEMRPEVLERTFATVGSLRPEELRAAKKRSLELEKRSKETLLVEVQRNRASIEQSLQRADSMVEKLRVKIEKEIDDALVDDDPVAPRTNKPIE